MPPDETADDMQEDGAAEAPESGGDQYAKAFRVLRHALADGDDEAGGMALRDAVKLCAPGAGDEPYDDDDGPPEKPNLAAILIGKKRKKD